MKNFVSNLSLTLFYFIQAKMKKFPHIGWLISSRNLWLMVLEAGSLKSGCQQCRVRAFCQVPVFLLHPHLVEGTGELCGLPFSRALTLFMRVPPPWPHHLLKGAHILKPSPLGVGISTYEFWWSIKIQTIADFYKTKKLERVFSKFLPTLLSIHTLFLFL